MARRCEDLKNYRFFSRSFRRIIFLFLFIYCLSAVSVYGDSVLFEEEKDSHQLALHLSNEKVRCSVMINGDLLEKDSLEAKAAWINGFGGDPFAVETNADFHIDLVWTGWRAPGKTGNAENPICLYKSNFRFIFYDTAESQEGGKELHLHFKALKSSLEVRITYFLEKDSFYARRKISVRDPKKRGHFLRWIWPYKSMVRTEAEGLKNGGFGQPLAFLTGSGGAFYGLEYPAGENQLKPYGDKGLEIVCGQEIGEKIHENWIESDWVVHGLSPNPFVKLWFNKYLERIRVAPLRPYLLYNTWYDVRAPEYTDRPEDVMNEKNLLRIIADFKRELFEKRNLSLDMFVLDDGWDIYKSDWVLRTEQFPNGLTPVVSALRDMRTGLGIWFGPIGGYSHRDWRVEWMREQGYETVGDQMCLAGVRYKRLFEKRSLDFIRNFDVGYFKWDGIQFSCSEQDHGHAIGIYSRTAVMKTVIDLCRSARAENPDIFLNVTSGTWLSPWWVQHANTIWMQGYDYGYSNVPSISRRDRAITYRDFVLYDGLRKNDFWFPIANLMTHGIIKGHLQKLGGDAEPLDKFTDNVVLYFARGVAMWELYISPNLLTDEEWSALTDSVRWAKDRFDLLHSTEMIGGDPGMREPYGYLHLSEKRGILAARNPFIEKSSIDIELSPAFGLDPETEDLVLERIYPTRWVSPQLYKAGSHIKIPLGGYETAVYEIYPLEETEEPLLCGAVFEIVDSNEHSRELNLIDINENAFLLNPERTSGISWRGQDSDPETIKIPGNPLPDPVKSASMDVKKQEDGLEIEISFELDSIADKAVLAVLFEADPESSLEAEFNSAAFLDGRKAELDTEQEKNQWAWLKLDVDSGSHSARMHLFPKENSVLLRGKVSAWFICEVNPEPVSLKIEMKENKDSVRPMLPNPWSPGTVKINIKIGESRLPH